MRALRPVRRLAGVLVVARALRVVEPLSWLTCYAVTGRRESWCARAWRRRQECGRARWHVRVFGPRHCRDVAQFWHD